MRRILERSYSMIDFRTNPGPTSIRLWISDAHRDEFGNKSSYEYPDGFSIPIDYVSMVPGEVRCSCPLLTKKNQLLCPIDSTWILS
jgi:hypothetical protein